MTDDFYTPPTLQPSRLPGDVLRMRPAFVPQLPGAGAAWQILYVSTNSRGDLIPASGIVIIPDTSNDTSLVSGPMLVYYPSFRGLGGPCAPSRSLVIGANPEHPDVAVLAAGLARGWVVAVPDGAGLGVTGVGPHTFLAARAGGQIVLDMARAAQYVPDLDTADPDTGIRDTPIPVVAWGYADGGRAVAAAGELHARYAPELDLRGLCAGAVVSDLAAIAPTVSTGAYAVLALAAVIGLSRAYPDLRLEYVLNEQGQHLAAQAATLTAEHLMDWYREPLSHWCHRTDPWNEPRWRDVLGMETLAHARPTMPLHLYHGTRDEVVPVGAGRRTMIAYRQSGAQVSWREYPTGHTGTAVDAITESITHLDEDLSRPRPVHHDRDLPSPGSGRAARA
ncbi:lipase family protein [Nocardia vaccinii]|uniref:lipase family protein n=1 Tax=Nocardia vaccinii TaxID=1822 RepID=UPI00082B3E84|nr:lipase family protein [Nocardia vaccinii]